MDDQEQLKPEVTARKNIHRREFFKVARAGAFALGSLAVGFDPNSQKESAEATSWQMPLTFSKTLDHVLHRVDIDQTKYGLILGEINSKLLAWWRLDLGQIGDGEPPVENLNQEVKSRIHSATHGGHGSSSEILENHLKYASIARTNGIAFAATDSPSYPLSLGRSRSESLGFLQESVGRKIQIGSLVGVLASYVMFMATKTKEDRKDSEHGESDQSLADQVRAFSKLAKLGAASATSIYLTVRYGDKLARLGEGDDWLKELNERLIENRDLNMTYNVRFIEKMMQESVGLRNLVDFGNGKSALFIRGGGHIRTKSAYSMGIDWLGKRLARAVDQDIDFIVNYLGAADKDPSLKIDPIGSLDFFAHIASSYHYPMATFFDSEVYKNMNALNMPDSPRLILWKNLSGRYAKAEGEEKDVLKKVIRRLIKEDLEHFSQQQRETFPEKRAMFDRVLAFDQTGEVRTIDMSEFAESPDERPQLKIFEGIPYMVNVVG